MILADILASDLEELIKEVPIKASPLALFLRDCLLLTDKGGIYVWHELASPITNNHPLFEKGMTDQGFYRKTIRIVVSIGSKYITDEDNFLDKLTEEVLTRMTNAKVDNYTPLIPREVSKTQKGRDNSTWKQVVFETNSKFQIPIREIQGKINDNG